MLSNGVGDRLIIYKFISGIGYVSHLLNYGLILDNDVPLVEFNILKLRAVLRRLEMYKSLVSRKQGMVQCKIRCLEVCVILSCRTPLA